MKIRNQLLSSTINNGLYTILLDIIYTQVHIIR